MRTEYIICYDRFNGPWSEAAFTLWAIVEIDILYGVDVSDWRIQFDHSAWLVIFSKP